MKKIVLLISFLSVIGFAYSISYEAIVASNEPGEADAVAVNDSQQEVIKSSFIKSAPAHTPSPAFQQEQGQVQGIFIIFQNETHRHSCFLSGCNVYGNAIY